jgi:hypothetical protein
MTVSTRLADTGGMTEPLPIFPRVVDGLTLPPEYRKALGREEWKDATGFPRQLPGYFLMRSRPDTP